MKRLVGAPGLYLFTISSMVGSTWLFSALYSAQFAGPASIVATALGGMIIFVIAMVYAEIGGIVPVVGASGAIPHITHGDYASFTASLLNWLGYVALPPLEVMAMVEYASDIFPLLTTSEDGNVSLTALGTAVSIPLLLAMVVINSYGVRFLAKATAPVAVWKIFVPSLTVVVLLATHFDASNLTDHGGFAPFGWSGVVGAVTSGGAILAFLGFRSTLELAGEAKNPGRTVPLVMLGAILTTIVLYTLLSLAFVGALSPAQLAGGWSALSAKTGAGPYASMALGLGLGWLATILFADAVVSPGGTAMAYTGIAARLVRAASINGHIPPRLGRLNAHGVPSISLWVNFAVGLILFVPFPGWQAMMTLVSSTLVLSLAWGPISLIALRAQVPDAERRFRLPAGIPVSGLGFVLSSFIVYWAGWKVAQLVLPLAIVGIVILPLLARRCGSPIDPLQRKTLIWLLPYLFGMLAMTGLGNYGGGLGIIPDGLDLVLVAALAAAVLMLSYRYRLSDEMSRNRLEAAFAGLEPAGRDPS